MFSSFNLLLFLIHIDQETILNWFGIEKSIISSVDKLESTSALSMETFHLISERLWQRIQDGLTLADIESIIFFLLFLRFILLIFRYNF